MVEDFNLLMVEDFNFLMKKWFRYIDGEVHRQCSRTISSLFASNSEANLDIFVLFCNVSVEPTASVIGSSVTLQTQTVVQSVEFQQID